MLHRPDTFRATWIALLILAGCGGDDTAGETVDDAASGASAGGAPSAGGIVGDAGDEPGGAAPQSGGAATGGARPSGGEGGDERSGAATGSAPTTGSVVIGGVATTGGSYADVCAGYPSSCFPLCEGGLCDCYCPVETGGSGGAGAEGGGGGGGDAPAGGGAASGGEAGGGAGDCADDCPTPGLTCCDGRCANLNNDPTNCGAGDEPCLGAEVRGYCEMGRCGRAPCDPACAGGELCCYRMLGAWGVGCAEPIDGTCPVDCPTCVCAAPDTPVATPEGERPIAELRVGDLVNSTDERGVVVVPIAQVNRAPVHHHQAMRVLLEGGSVLEVSARHPTADGRTFGELSPGTRLDGRLVVAAELVPYSHELTYDILPASSPATYYAAGALIGSTLTRAR